MNGRIFYRLITAEGLVAFSADDRPRVVDYVASLAPDVAARCTLETCQVMSVEALGRPIESWPLCATCGKGAREGNHATDLGLGHDYVPSEAKGDERDTLVPPAGAVWPEDEVTKVEAAGG